MYHESGTPMKTLILTLLLAATVSAAQPRMGGMHRGGEPGRMHARIVRQLDLSADQKAQFDKLSSKMMKEGIDLRSKIATARVDLKDLASAEKPDKGAITAKMAEINKLQGEMQASHVSFWFEVNSILKPEQQATWKKALQRPMAGSFEGRGRMMHRGDQPE